MPLYHSAKNDQHLVGGRWRIPDERSEASESYDLWELLHNWPIGPSQDFVAPPLPDKARLQADLVGFLKEASARLSYFVSAQNKVELVKGKASAPEQEGLYFVLRFPQEQGPISAAEGLAMLCLTRRLAPVLAELIHGKPGCWHINLNGPEVGSLPGIEHYHIHLYRDQEHKLRTQAAVINRRLEALEILEKL